MFKNKFHTFVGVVGIVGMSAIIGGCGIIGGPDVYEVAHENLQGETGIEYYGDEESVTIEVSTYILPSTEEAFQETLEEYGFSSAVMNRMYQTRAIDGTQNAESNGVNVSWTFHPDAGLQVVVERD